MALGAEVECDSELTFEIFESLVQNSNLLPLIEKRLLLEEQYNTKECYENAHELLKLKIESIAKLLKDRLLKANSYNEHWEHRIQRLIELALKENCPLCKLYQYHSYLYPLQTIT